MQVVGCVGFNAAVLGCDSSFVYGPSSWTLNSSLQTDRFEAGRFDIGRFDITVCEYCNQMNANLALSVKLG